MTEAVLLLADPSPCLRSLVLRDLFHRGADDVELCELVELRDTDALAVDLLALQETDGSWKAGDLSWSSRGGTDLMTALALGRLGYLGFGPDHSAVFRGAEYLFLRQQKDGSWPLVRGKEATDEGEGYSMIPLQTAMPLRALAACGYANDPRAERAYDWLLAQRLPDGSWPTGIAKGNYGYVAGYRRLSHSHWGCRANTTGALSCLALHQGRRTSSEAQQALDLLLGRETRESYTLGFEVARRIGAEQARGLVSHFARFDLAQILDLCWRIGATRDDERIAELITYVQGLQGTHGLWEYAPRPQASRWVTFDLLRSLSRLDKSGDWVNCEPRTPFHPYPKQARRY